MTANKNRQTNEATHVAGCETNKWSNYNTYPWPADKCLTDLLSQQAESTPDRIALTFESHDITFRDFTRKASVIGGYLRHLGVKPDDCIGLFTEPSLELMLGAWGILFAGAAYLPLAPEYPEERLRFMVEDSRTKIIFTQRQLRPALLAIAPRDVLVVTYEDAAQFIDESSTTGQPLHAPTPKNLAYVIYTSGSTGKPKGVMIEHGSIVNQMHWMKTTYGLNSSSSIIQKTPMSFDAAQWEILAPTCGARVVMAKPGMCRDAEGLIETIRSNKVTILQCVPTLLQALLDKDQFQQCDSLTQIFCGGEALCKKLPIECVAKMPHCEIINLYGPTECTINSSSYKIDRTTLEDMPNTISIGAPVFNTSYLILDALQRPVGVGQTGELHIGGISLARGYLNRPDLTSEKFVANPFGGEGGHERLYKTGDLTYWNSDGTVQFVGRVDNQVKVRGHRIELDEIRTAIETHSWVANAAAIVKENPETGQQDLVAFVELNPKEAALMDQGDHDSHHQNKQSRLQVKAQLSNQGCRDVEMDGDTISILPGRVPTIKQNQLVFGRKTYRFFEGGDSCKADILRLLRPKLRKVKGRELSSLRLAVLGRLLRYFGQFESKERLLPKYGYASPGALYATQLYVEVENIAGLENGYYYYHPVHHRLVLISSKDTPNRRSRLVAHFIGKTSAIRPVYKNNIREVLEIETGHILGLFDELLPTFGLGFTDAQYEPSIGDILKSHEDDEYLGSFALGSASECQVDEGVDIYVQSHPNKIADLPAGQYRYVNGDLEKISDSIIERKHVIAINQAVYERASFGITVVSRNITLWRQYIDLGRNLQRFQMNNIRLGLMSSGYSSKTGNSLPAAKRMADILEEGGLSNGPSYFFVGGKISEEQFRSTGMKEDMVHSKGPAEMIREDLSNYLPDYMIPNKVILLNRMPLTANGKVDVKALSQVQFEFARKPMCPPRTVTEKQLSEIWKRELKRDQISVHDDFFDMGGNSLSAVSIIAEVARTFECALPLQVLFGSPTVEKVAAAIERQKTEGSRLIALNRSDSDRAVFCWPGLGGYTMNLRMLAERVSEDCSLYGVQAHGINEGETAYPTIQEMASHDVALIRAKQPSGPYHLWGYSFGARVAFEAAYQLEQAGEEVASLCLIAPGSPHVNSGIQDAPTPEAERLFESRAFVSILFSVFAGGIKHAYLEECLETVKDEDGVVSYLTTKFEKLERRFVERIVKIVALTYQFKYSFYELRERKVQAPITILKARGDDYSFLESSSGYSWQEPAVYSLTADHYGVLREVGVDELAGVLRSTHNGEFTLSAQVELKKVA